MIALNKYKILFIFIWIIIFIIFLPKYDGHYDNEKCMMFSLALSLAAAPLALILHVTAGMLLSVIVTAGFDVTPGNGSIFSYYVASIVIWIICSLSAYFQWFHMAPRLYKYVKNPSI